MQVLRRGLAALLAAATLALLPGGTLAGSPVPLRGGDSGEFEAAEACGNGGLRIVIGGAGHASQLGRYAYSASECFDPASGTFAGSATLIAADGSRLSGSYAGTVAATDDPDVIAYEEVFRIAGGTGRFGGASGSVRVVGWANLATGDYGQEIDGWLLR